MNKIRKSETTKPTANQLKQFLEKKIIMAQEKNT